MSHGFQKSILHGRMITQFWRYGAINREEKVSTVTLLGILKANVNSSRMQGTEDLGSLWFLHPPTVWAHHRV